MTDWKCAGLLASAFIVLASASAGAAPINLVPPGSLTGSALITFDDVAGGTAPGTNYDSIFESDGANFGERFAGQTFGTSGDFDVLSGNPTGPLSLVAGNPGQNLNLFVTLETGSQALTGLGPAGFPNNLAIGEGSFAVLFDFDQSEFGFDLVGGNGGTAFVSFFQRDGSLIDVVELTNLENLSYAFQREGGVNDIAGISIHNTDPGGIGFDNLVHDVQGVPGTPPAIEVPEPASLALLGLGLTGLGFAVRRRRPV